MQPVRLCARQIHHTDTSVDTAHPDKKFFYIGLVLLWVVPIIITCTLSGCGFRSATTTTMAPALRHLYLQTNTPYAPFMVLLRQTLHDRGVTFSTREQAAPLTLVILSHQFSRQTRGIGPVNYYANRFYRYRLRYLLRIGDTLVVTPARQLTVSSESVTNRTPIVGSNDQHRVKRYLAQALIEKLLFVLNAPATRRAIAAAQQHTNPHSRHNNTTTARS